MRFHGAMRQRLRTMTAEQSASSCAVTTFYPPCNFGGDGIYIRNFVHSLARRGCEVEVIYDADPGRSSEAPCVHRPLPRRFRSRRA